MLRAEQGPGLITGAWIGASWIMEVAARGTGRGKPFHANPLLLSNLRTTPEAQRLQLQDRRSLEGWRRFRDTQLHEDAHSDRGHGAGVMARLHTAAMNLLRLTGFRSIRSGLQAVMHDITALLAMAITMAMATRRPEPTLC